MLGYAYCTMHSTNKMGVFLNYKEFGRNGVQSYKGRVSYEEILKD
jgi:hypothetical protein